MSYDASKIACSDEHGCHIKIFNTITVKLMRNFYRGRNQKKIE